MKKYIFCFLGLIICNNAYAMKRTPIYDIFPPQLVQFPITVDFENGTGKDLCISYGQSKAWINELLPRGSNRTLPVKVPATFLEFTKSDSKKIATCYSLTFYISQKHRSYNQSLGSLVIDIDMSREPSAPFKAEVIKQTIRLKFGNKKQSVRTTFQEERDYYE